MPGVLSTSRGHRPRAVLKTEWNEVGGGMRQIGLRTACKQSFYVP